MIYGIYRYIASIIISGIMIGGIVGGVALLRNQEYRVYEQLATDKTDITYNEDRPHYTISIPTLRYWSDPYYSVVYDFDTDISSAPRIGIIRDKRIQKDDEVYVAFQIENNQVAWIQGVYEEYPQKLEKQYAIVKATVQSTENIDQKSDIESDTFRSLDPQIGSIILEYGFEKQEIEGDTFEIQSEQIIFAKFTFTQGGNLQLESLFNGKRKIL